MTVKIIGIMAILLGLLGLAVGLDSIIYGTGHDLSSALYHGLLFLVAGIGLFLKKRWGIILFTTPFLLLLYLELKLILNKGIYNGFYTSVVLLLIYLLLTLILFTKWNQCKWN